VFIASIIKGWFVARDTASLDLTEMVVSLLLTIVFLAVGAFSPYLVAWFADRCAVRRSRAPFGTENAAP
jgi:hypothetical protein